MKTIHSFKIKDSKDGAIRLDMYLFASGTYIVRVVAKHDFTLFEKYHYEGIAPDNYQKALGTIYDMKGKYNFTDLSFQS